MVEAKRSENRQYLPISPRHQSADISEVTLEFTGLSAVFHMPFRMGTSLAFTDVCEVSKIRCTEA